MKRLLLSLVAGLGITAVVTGCGPSEAEKAQAKHDAAMLEIAKVNAQATAEHDAAVAAEQKVKEEAQAKARVALAGYQAAITNVITQCIEIDAREIKETKRGATTNLSNAKFVAGLYKIDITGCPEKFRVAWIDLIHTYERNESVLDGVDLAVKQEAYVAETAVGAVRLNADAMKDGLQRQDAMDVDEARRRVETAALQYGIQLHR